MITATWESHTKRNGPRLLCVSLFHWPLEYILYGQTGLKDTVRQIEGPHWRSTVEMGFFNYHLFFMIYSFFFFFGGGGGLEGEI